jgi:uncharacterized protein YjaG (DUF416 family)
VKIRDFDRGEYLRKLTRLSDHQRAAYAIACAERLLPLYGWFEAAESWGDKTVLERSVEVAWKWVKGQAETQQISDAIEACEEVTPDTEDFSSGLASRALDAASATAQALQTCLNPLPETALEAGEISWECAFGIEQSGTSQSTGPYVADPRLLGELAHGSFVQLEEKLQAQSLETLGKLALTFEEVDEFRQHFGKLKGHYSDYR